MMAAPAGARLWRSNRVFFAGLVATTLVLTLLVIWPLLDLTPPWSAPSDRADKCYHHHRRTGPAKFFWVAGAVSLGHFLLGLRQARLRNARAAAVAFTLLFNAGLVHANVHLAAYQRLTDEVAFGTLHERRWENYCHLQMIEHRPLGLPSNLRDVLRKRQPQSLEDVHRFVMDLYGAEAPRLRKRLDLHSENLTRAAYLMNFVSALWAFGNRKAVDEPGSALANENNDWAGSPPTLSAYLSSSIACCADYSYLAKALFDREGIENRLVAIPGHIFNEVRVDGRWHVMDATTNLLLESSWEDLFAEKSPETVRVHIFPHAGLARTDSKKYRPRVGQFRLLMLSRIVNRPPLFRDLSYPPLPPFFGEQSARTIKGE